METEFITGAAGTGKTTLIAQRIQETPNYGALCATTGIAAVNLGPNISTINSALGYYDLSDLKGKFIKGKLKTKLKAFLVKHGAKLIIDEISMMGAEPLDIIYDTMHDISEEKTCPPGLGMIVTGDFLQLPPVKQPWAFTAQCWPEFEASTTMLTKVHRQSHPEFLRILQQIRRGDNIMAPLDLAKIPEVTWTDYPDHDFPGTTIFGVNKEVNRMNRIRLNALKRQGLKPINFKAYRWGKQKGEWKLIPEILEVTEQAYVMILINEPQTFSYANGDCGEVTQLEEGKCVIKLRRDGSTAVIPWVTRRYEVEGMPQDYPLAPEKAKSFSEWKKSMEETEWADEDISVLTTDQQKTKYKGYLVSMTNKYKQWGRPYYDYDKDVYVLGEVVYMPVRLAWATTVHKSQGLTLDQVQVDMGHGFFGGPSMA